MITTASPAAHVVGPTADQALDIRPSDLLHLRLVGAGDVDRAAVEAQFGPAGNPAPGRPDLTIRYVDHVELKGNLRYLGPGEAGFSDDGFFVLRGRFRRPVKVRLPFADLGGPCEIVCERGVGRVPHLVALVNLAILANGGLALHASGFEVDGRAAVATGWSKGGKTEALLVHCQRGARYVGDEWLHLHPDGRVSGIDEPLRVWDWQLDQLPAIRAHVDRRDRARLQALGLAGRSFGGRSQRAATAVAKQRFVDLDHTAIAPAGRVAEPLPIGPVHLMTSADQTTSAVRTITGSEVAERMAASLTFERTPLLEAVAAFRYAFPGEAAGIIDEIPALERERLHQLLDHVRAAEVTHPYPVDLAELGDAMAAWREEAP